MDLTFVDKLASRNSGVNYLLVAVYIFFRDFCQSSNNENKMCQRQFTSFQKNKNTPEKLWVDKRTDYGGTFKNFCKEKDIEVYSSMSETKAAFAERAIQSFKHIIYRYIEDHGENFVPKLQQIVSTLNCRKNRSIGKFPREVKNCDFLSIIFYISFKKHTKLISKLVIELEF